MLIRCKKTDWHWSSTCCNVLWLLSREWIFGKIDESKYLRLELIKSLNIQLGENGRKSNIAVN